MRWLVVLLVLCALPAAASDVAAVRARYALKRGNHVEHLELVRAGDRVSHEFVERGVRELWQRDARGDLEHWRAYPAQGKSVHYAPGDLRTINLWPRWDALTQLISAQELASLTRNKKNVLEGTLRGQPARVEWRDDVALPRRITLGQLTMELLSVEPVSAVQSDTLESIEFADLGDKEYDPFVRRFLAHHQHEHPLH
ncbi:MAG TPA: hypothetical protein VFX59_10550 [Polyangiales bacterium]|nr:hypothetical protein [Polyangiales bacterium]